MDIIDLNSNGGIGSNSMYCELGPFRFAIDSGLDPKEDGKAALPELRKIPNGALDFIILTHCHLDHLGSLPVLLRRQPYAQIFCSIGTAELVPTMLKNSYKVMHRVREEKGINEYPLFSRPEMRTTEERLRALTFGDTITFNGHGESLDITLYPAGHVPGACAVLIEYKHRKIFITGDVLFNNMTTLKGANFPKDKVDTLVIETTRGATTASIH